MNNDKNLILKLNNYGYSQEVLDEVLRFKTTGEIPEHIKGKARYRKKWQPFYIADNHLIYRPKELKVIIDPDEKQQIMKAVYDSMGTNFDPNMGRAEQYYNEIYNK